MYIRKKLVREHTYYQVVEGVRDGAHVYQRVVVALGTTPKPTVALADMKAALAELRRKRREWPRGHVSESRTINAQINRLDARIEELKARIETLSKIIKNREITPTNRKGG
jgi:hypothetical protein